jgi:hypothetical protein
MAKYLDECFQIISKAFPSDWINNPIFNSSNPEYLQNLLSLVNNTHNDLIYNLHLSVISGEYIEDLKFEERLEEFKILIEGIPSIPDSQILLAEIESLSNILMQEFYLPYERALKYYRNLVSYSNTIINGNLQETIMDVFLHPDNLSENKKSVQLESINDFIKYNIKLAKIDLSIVTSDTILKELLLIKEGLENKNNKSFIFKLLLNKCNFLIKKIILRYKKTALLYKINFKYSSLKPETFEVGEFDYFDRNIAVHDSNNPDIESTNLPKYNEYIRTSQSKFIDNSELTYEDYHTLIRYYKDISPDKLSLKKLIDAFEKEILKKNLSNFDIRAHNISLNNLRNHYFSFLLSEKTNTLEIINEYFNKIVLTQKSTRIFNFFPYERFIKYLFCQLKVIYEKNTSESEIEKAEVLLTRLKDLIKDLKLNFSWCEENKFLNFQHPFAECVFNYKHSETELIPIFLNSSFVLPTNFNDDENKIKELIEELVSFETIHKVHRSISKEKKEIRETKDEVKETKNKLDQSDKRNIEILSIFSAIVVFATATTQLFPFIKSTSGALQFMLVFSFSLCSFVLVIWLITRESEIRKLDFPILHKSFLAAFILITIILGIESYYFKEPNFITYTEKFKTDSINISQLKKIHIIDSLKMNTLNSRLDSLIKSPPSLDSTRMQRNNH